MNNERSLLRRAQVRMHRASVLIALLYPASGIAAEGYQLGPMDKLNIKVVESRDSQDSFKEWPALNGLYIVGPTGSILLPYAGEVAVSGKTPADIAAEIAVNIQLKFGLSALPETAVEIAEYRGIYVVGDVTTPGFYAFSPDLTPLKALALAGGVSRGGESPEKTTQDFLAVSGELAVLTAQRDFLLIKQARLSAELDEATQIASPANARPGEYTSDLLASQKKLMTARQETMTSQLNSLNEIKSLYSNEVVSLEQKSVTQSRQIQLVTKELEKANKLADQGLVLSARVLGLESTIADLQGNLIDLGTATLRAKQEISKADREASELHNERRAELVVEVQETQSSLKETELKITSANERMAALAIASPALAGQSMSDLQDRLTYRISRVVDGKAQDIDALAHTALTPGDLINVKLQRQGFDSTMGSTPASIKTVSANR
jgi:polysaccharide biosynthesis/export protein ExoF